MWSNVHLGNVAIVNWGNTSITKKSYVEKGYPAYSATGNDGYLGHFEYEGKGIILSAIGAQCGKCFRAEGKWTAIKNTITITKPKEELVDLDYIFYFTNQDGVWPRRGGGQPFIALGDARKLHIPLPPLSEQRRIVEILDQADGLRKKRAEANEKATRILPALFCKMVGDPVTNPMGWSQAPLREMLPMEKGALQSGPFGSQLHNHDFVENGTVLAVGIDNVHDTGFEWGRRRRITEEKYEELKKFTLKPGDVLITIMGTIGRTCVFPYWAGRAICTKHVYRIRVDRNKLDPEYVSASIRFSHFVRSQLGASVTGQIVKGITSKDLKGLHFHVPPIELQQRFAEMKETLDQNLAARSNSGKTIDRLFHVLLHRAFAGDLTAKWREVRMEQLLAEVEAQAKALKLEMVH